MKIYFSILLFAVLMGCQSDSPRTLQHTLDEFEQELLLLFPDYAAAMGQEDATEILILPTVERLARELDFCKKYERVFNNFSDFPETPDLNDQRKEKLEILNGMILRMTGQQSPTNNPAYYDVYPALARRIFQIKNKQSDGVERLEFTLRKVPAYFALAKKNLQNPDLEQTAKAIQQQKKSIDFLSGTVVDTVDEVIAIEARKRLEKARHNAILAAKDYHGFCNSIWVELKKLE